MMQVSFSMTSIKVSTEWLHESWGKTATHEKNPHMYVDGTNLSIIIFPKGESAMRVMRRTVEKTSTIGFEVVPALRCFVKMLLGFKEITLNINNQGLSVIAENPNSAIEYRFSNIDIVQKNEIEPHEDDIEIKLPTEEWLNIWKSIPPKGQVTIECQKKRKSITIKHSKQRWVGAIQGCHVPTDSKTFTTDAMVIKRIFALCTPETVFSHICFMKCGVFKWKQKNTEIYIAPNIDV